MFAAPPESFEGQCQCGNLRYRVTGQSAALFACHCTECQRQSSSAFGMALWIRSYDKDVTGGTLGTFVRKTPSGKELAGEFCVACGTRLFHQITAQSEILSIKPGTLNDTRHLEPVAHIWTSSAQRWLILPPSVLVYPENPPSFDEIFAAWRDGAKGRRASAPLG